MSPPGKLPRLTFVVQRYGPEIVGGAEQLARAWAQLLAHRADVTVITTAARDERTWRNELPVGESRDGPVRLLRFPVVHERTIYFHRLHAMLQASMDTFGAGAVIAGLPSRGSRARGSSPPDASANQGSGSVRLRITAALELEWLRAEGPWSPELLRHLETDTSDRCVFFSYLYPTTIFGLRIVSARAFVVPTLHDELPAHFESVRAAMGAAAGRIWISRGEQELGGRLWSLSDGPILSMPLTDPGGDSQSARNRTAKESPPRGERTILYSGRIDSGKGVGELIEFHRRFKAELAMPVRLVLTGRVAMRIPEASGITVLGFVSEAEKRRLMHDADVFVMPSTRESLSISVLEAMREGTPVLVNGRSPVLCDHVADSGGGAVYQDYRSFAQELSRMLADDNLRRELGGRGRNYAQHLTDPDRVREGLWNALGLGSVSGGQSGQA